MVKEIEANEVKWIKNRCIMHTVGGQSQWTIPSLYIGVLRLCGEMYFKPKFKDSNLIL